MWQCGTGGFQFFSEQSSSLHGVAVNCFDNEPGYEDGTAACACLWVIGMIYFVYTHSLHAVYPQQVFHTLPS